MAVVSKLHDGALFANQLYQRPFNSLPTEAIADIFLHTLRAQNPSFPSIIAAPLVFLLVCRRWNRIALSIPLLWTDVVLDEAPDGVREIEREEKALMIWLHRSGRRPMSLKMMRTPLPLDSDVKELESDLNPGVKDRRNELGYALGKVLPRCRDVVVQSNSSVIDVVLYHLRECAATGPLKQLALIFIRRPLSFGPDGLDNVYLDLSIFHRLHSIDVQTQPKGPYEADIKVTCAPPTRQFMRLSRLLQFSLERVSPDVAVEWLQSCPNVRTLAVAVDLPEPTEPVVRDRSGEIPMHEHLQDLWLAFNTDLKIYRDAGDGSTKAHQEFSPVHLPSIKRLTVELSLKGEGDPSETANFRKLHRTHGRVLTRIMHQLLQNSPQLTGLTLLGTRATTVEDMLALLEAIPTLKEITIDGCFTDFAGVLMALSPHDCSGAAPRIRGLCPVLERLTINNFSWMELEQGAVLALVCSRWAVRGFYRFPCDCCRKERLEKTKNITRHHLVQNSFKCLTVDPPYNVANRIQKEEPLATGLEVLHRDLYQMLSYRKSPLKEILEGSEFTFYEVDRSAYEPSGEFLEQ